MNEDQETQAGQSALREIYLSALAAWKVVSIKGARWLAMLMAFTLWGASVWWPDWRRIAASAGCTLFLAYLLRKEK